MPEHDTCVAVFARAPIWGSVKTRLAAVLGNDVALAVHRELLRETLDNVLDPGSYALELWLAGDPISLEAEPSPLNVELRQQLDGDLGDRMLAAITHLAEAGHHAIIIGCDCPLMNRDYVRRAASALHDHDLVIGPAEDGGYTLIGMRRPIPELFVDMSWSVPSVLNETLRRAVELDLRVAQFETLWDVDTAADWRRWRALRT
jgi:rSAM/selenodomain-associated transferase 1